MFNFTIAVDWNHFGRCNQLCILCSGAIHQHNRYLGFGLQISCSSCCFKWPRFVAQVLLYVFSALLGHFSATEVFLFCMLDSSLVSNFRIHVLISRFGYSSDHLSILLSLWLTCLEQERQAVFFARLEVTQTLLVSWRYSIVTLQEKIPIRLKITFSSLYVIECILFSSWA